MQIFLKNLICWLHGNNLQNVAYLSLQMVALLVSHLLALPFGRKLGMRTHRAFIAVVTEVAIVYIQMAIICEILEEIVPSHIPIMNSYYNNVGRTFILVPFSAVLTSKILKHDLKRTLALYAFAQPLIWGLASLPCLLAGCCRGYPCEWGVYNVEAQTYVFPTQALNAIGLCAIVCFIVIRTKKRGYEPDGLEYPIALILIGLTRFCTEFLMDNPKIAYGLSSLSFDSLVMMATGLVSLLVISCMNRNKRRAVFSAK